MTRFVVDASVAAKWFLPETEIDLARSLLFGASQLSAPDFIRVELASVLGQRRRKGEMTLKDAIGILNDFAALPLVVVPAIALVAPALALMERISCSIYDGIYLALAEQLGVPLVTADRKLAQAARADPHGPPIRLLAEMG